MAEFKVCVCGGAGGIGQPLCLFLAMNEYVSELCIYDLDVAMVPANGVATDLSHIEKSVKVKAYTLSKDEKPIHHLGECLTGCDLVLIPAGLPRKPGMSRADLLGVNGGIAKGIVEACGKYCPNAVLGLIVNPVNSVVPAMCELYKRKGLNPKKICGVTTLDCVRANKFVHEITGIDLDDINVPVVCGHSGATIVPLFSQDPSCREVAPDMIAALDRRVQAAGDEVVNAKDGKGSATLSMAYAGARFASAVLAGLAGEKDIRQCAYVMSDVVPEVPYFASLVTFGREGVDFVHPIGDLSEHEQERMREATEQLKEEIKAGLDYAKSQVFFMIDVRR